MTPDPKKQSIIKAPSRAVAKARSNMASRALASVHKTTITNSIGMKLKLIPAGEFLMGSPESETVFPLELLGSGDEQYEDESQHQVRITKPFYMGVYTVTQSDWVSVMGSEPWAGKRFIKQGSDYPVTYVSHDGAVEFCHKLSELENAPYRLPTEAEWEYACGAGSQTAYCFGDNADQLGQYAWFCENADHIGEKYSHRVGQKLPNGFGLYDMHGNVWEWCSDWHGEYLGGTLDDPTGPAEGAFRVIRGGYSRSPDWDCRSAYRHKCKPSVQIAAIGFRVAMSPSGK